MSDGSQGKAFSLCEPRAYFALVSSACRSLATGGYVPHLTIYFVHVCAVDVCRENSKEGYVTVGGMDKRVFVKGMDINRVSPVVCHPAHATPNYCDTSATAGAVAVAAAAAVNVTAAVDVAAAVAVDVCALSLLLVLCLLRVVQGSGQGCPAAPQGPQDCKPSTLNFHILPLV